MVVGHCLLSLDEICLTGLHIKPPCDRFCCEQISAVLHATCLQTVLHEPQMEAVGLQVKPFTLKIFFFHGDFIVVHFFLYFA